MGARVLGVVVVGGEGGGCGDGRGRGDGTLYSSSSFLPFFFSFLSSLFFLSVSSLVSSSANDLFILIYFLPYPLLFLI